MLRKYLLIGLILRRTTISTANKLAQKLRQSRSIRSQFDVIQSETVKPAQFLNIAHAIYSRPLKFKIAALSLVVMFCSTSMVSGYGLPRNNSEEAYVDNNQEIAFGEVGSTSEGILVKPEGLIATNVQRVGMNDMLKYTVRAGDSLSTIADRFGINVETIQAVNNLRLNSTLRAGQSLLILPVNGLAYTVQTGDTLDKIAKKYNVEKEAIAEQNKLQGGLVAMNATLIIPGAKPVEIIDPPSAEPKRSLYASMFFNSSAKKGTMSSFSRFASNCVLAERQKNPNLPRGLFTLQQKIANIQGDTPVAGATLVTNEGRNTGHVAHVEKVKGDKIYVSECNYHHGKCTTRVLDKNSAVIEGYIY